jgi:hypothetical protein
MIFSKNRFPLFRIMLMLWPNRIIEHLFAEITLIERTGKGRERAMANGVVVRGKLNSTHHRRLESIARRNAGESMTDIGRSYDFSHRTIRRL